MVSSDTPQSPVQEESEEPWEHSPTAARLIQNPFLLGQSWEHSDMASRLPQNPFLDLSPRTASRLLRNPFLELPSDTAARLHQDPYLQLPSDTAARLLQNPFLELPPHSDSSRHLQAPSLDLPSHTTSLMRQSSFLGPPSHSASSRMIQTPSVELPSHTGSRMRQSSFLELPSHTASSATLQNPFLEGLSHSTSSLQNPFLKRLSYTAPATLTTQNAGGVDSLNNDVETVEVNDRTVPTKVRQGKKVVRHHRAQQVQAGSNKDISTATGRPTMSESGEIGEELAASSQSKDGTNALDKYAFNFDRDAYSHRVPRRLTVGITLNVGKLDGKVSVAQHREEARIKGQADVCPPLLPLPQEMHEPSSKKTVCFWVGMLPSQDRTDQDNTVPCEASSSTVGEDSPKRPAKKKARGSSSVADLSEDEMNIIPYDPNALRVVAKKSDKVTTAWCLYALINPNQSDKLCQGFRVEFEKVYFFKAFRDDEATGFQSRKIAMKERIKAKIFPALPPPDVAQSPTATPTVEKKQAANAPRLTEGQSLSTLSKLKRLARTPLPDQRDKRPLATNKASSASGDLVDQKTGTSTAKIPDVDFGDKQNAIAQAREQAHAQPQVQNLEGQVHGLADGNLNSHGRGRESVMRHDDGSAPGPDDAELMEGLKDLVFDNMDLNKSLSDLLTSPIHDDPDDKVDAPGVSTKMTRKGKGKSVMFRDEDGQTLDNNSSVVQPSSLTSDEHAGQNEEDSPSLVDQQKATDLANKIAKMAKRLAGQTDIAALRQGLAMLKSLKDRRGPPKRRALGLYLNVPTDEDLDFEACATKLDELLVSRQTKAPTPLKRKEPAVLEEPNSIAPSAVRNILTLSAIGPFSHSRW